MVAAVDHRDGEHVRDVWLCVAELGPRREHPHVLARGAHLLVGELQAQAVVELRPCHPRYPNTVHRDARCQCRASQRASRDKGACHARAGARAYHSCPATVAWHAGRGSRCEAAGYRRGWPPAAAPASSVRSQGGEEGRTEGQTRTLSSRGFGDGMAAGERLPDFPAPAPPPPLPRSPDQARPRPPTPDVHTSL